MAYIAQVSIRSSSHMDNAIEYISREEKALTLNEFKEALNDRLIHLQHINASSGERSTCINCSPVATAKEFENLRRIYNQDKGVIAHHYYQSFQKDDNVTPELAHTIGVELAKKMFPNYKVVVATHVDRDHLHNHIIVNSCNMLTGQKWHSNKSSLSTIRKESDKLCLANGLGVIDKNSKYKGIDRTTYQLGMKGKSWKINLVHDLDSAVKQCHSKENFISFLQMKDYTVKYNEAHITITKNGEKKGIRVDTLAKQFGAKYKKDSLEKQMGYYVPIEKKENAKPVRKSPVKSTKSNWEYYEQNIFKQSNSLPSTVEKVVYNQYANRMIDSAARSMIYSRNIFELIFKAIIFIAALSDRKRSRPYVKYRKVQLLKKTTPRRYFSYGNISYSQLRETFGDTYSVKVSIDKLLLLVNQPILYSAKCSKENNSVTITIKEKDKNFLFEVLKMNRQRELFDNQSAKLSNSSTYKELKQLAEQCGVKLQYMIVTNEQLQILKDNFIKLAYFEKEDKINIAFMPEKAELIKKLLYPENKTQQETPEHRNNRIYAQLKQSAALSGEKLKFRTKLTNEQLDEVRSSGVTFAYFTNSDNRQLFNIAFEREDEEKVDEILKKRKLIQDYYSDKDNDGIPDRIDSTFNPNENNQRR